MRQDAPEAMRRRSLFYLRQVGVHVMQRGVTLLAALAALSFAAPSAQSQEKVKVGLIVTLSGPAAVLGGQVRDGFNLAVKALGGKLGGAEAGGGVVGGGRKA